MLLTLRTWCSLSIYSLTTVCYRSYSVASHVYVFWFIVMANIWHSSIPPCTLALTKSLSLIIFLTRISSKICKEQSPCSSAPKYLHPYMLQCYGIRTACLILIHKTVMLSMLWHFMDSCWLLGLEALLFNFAECMNIF